MKQYEKVFDPLYYNMVEAGETGGILDTILQRLSQYIEKNVKLKRAVRSAMIYPISVLGIAGMVIVALIWKVVPIFVTLFNGLDVDLPLPTRIVIGLSNFVGSIWGLMLIILFIASGVAIKFWYATPQGRYVIDGLSLKAPVVGLILRKIAVARFTRTLGTLISSGVPILEGLDITARTSGNAVVERAISQTRKAVEAGRSLVDPLKETNVFPGMVTLDDQRRRADWRDGRHAPENRGFLRGRSGRGRQGYVDRHRTSHDRLFGRGRRRRCYFHVFAVVLPD